MSWAFRGLMWPQLLGMVPKKGMACQWSWQRAQLIVVPPKLHSFIQSLA